MHEEPFISCTYDIKRLLGNVLLLKVAETGNERKLKVFKAFLIFCRLGLEQEIKWRRTHLEFHVKKGPTKPRGPDPPQGRVGTVALMMVETRSSVLASIAGRVLPGW